MKKMKDLKRGDKVWHCYAGGCQAYYVRKIRVCEPCVVISLDWESGYSLRRSIVGHASGWMAIDRDGGVYYSYEHEAKREAESKELANVMRDLRDVVKCLLKK